MSNANTAAPVRGKRPTNPAEISFARDCFETVGERVYYKVVFSAPHYPERFDNIADAEKRARRCNREVTECREPIERRIKWN